VASHLPKLPNVARKKVKKNKMTEAKREKFLSEITDLSIWKKAMGIPRKTRIFQASGGYSTLVDDLEGRGWVRNKNFFSPCFNFRWALHKLDIPYRSLLHEQIVNHFANNQILVQKKGLCETLKNLIWHNNVDIDTFFPRCFYLNNINDYEDF